MHFIGFSLGAHISGQAAELLKLNNITVDRITALDPAEPCFDEVNLPLRLNKTNADFIDVIHTDVAEDYNTAFGILEPMGKFKKNFLLDFL